MSADAQGQARSDRERLASDLERIHGLTARWTPPTNLDWLDGLFKPLKKRVEFPAPWRHLPTLQQTPVLKTRVDVDTRSVEDSFRLAPPAHEWRLDDHWLARLARRLPEAEERASALRLLVLHELAHRGPQTLTRTSSQEIGRFPKVLEEIDFQADVWALLHEYELTRQQTPRQVENAPRFFLSLVRRATETMWAFDDGPPLREIQIRRLNRYLIWYWMHLLLERVESHGQGDSLDAVLSLLAHRPVLELAGPPLRTQDGRIFFDLDPRRMREPEFAIYHEGRLHRHGPRPDFSIDALLAGVRERDGHILLESLRGAFEQTVR